MKAVRFVFEVFGIFFVGIAIFVSVGLNPTRVTMGLMILFSALAAYMLEEEGK